MNREQLHALLSEARQQVQTPGQGSAFEDEHGYCLDPVSPNLPSFPEGWQDRLMRDRAIGSVLKHFPPR